MSEFLRIFRIPDLDWDLVPDLTSRIERHGVAMSGESVVLYRPRVRGWRRVLRLLTRNSRPVIGSTGSIHAATLSPSMNEVPVFYNSLQAAANAVRLEGAPYHYELVIRGVLGTSLFAFTVRRGLNLTGEESLIASTYGGLESESFYALTEFLGFRAEPCDLSLGNPGSSVR
jgi:hypothetical protein